MANIVSKCRPAGLAKCNKDSCTRSHPNNPPECPHTACDASYHNSLHHEVCQAPRLVSHWAYVRMLLRLKLNVLLRAFRVYTDLTGSNIKYHNRHCGPMDVQKLPCCALDQHSLERRIPENGVRIEYRTRNKHWGTVVHRPLCSIA
jgi:hypothetical protein